MKKITLLLLFLLSCTAHYGQHKVAQKIERLETAHTPFRHLQPLLKSQVPLSPEINKLVRNATSLTVNKTVMQDIATNKYGYIEIDVPYNNAFLTVQLYRVEITTKEFHIDIPGQKNVSFVSGAHYQGIIKGDGTSLASFNFFNNEMNGTLSGSSFNNLTVGRLGNAVNSPDYVVYSDSDLIAAPGFQCHTPEMPLHPDTKAVSKQPEPNSKCVTVTLVVTQDLFLATGGTLELTTNWLFSLANGVECMYYNDDVNVLLDMAYIWSEPDPYTCSGSQECVNLFAETADFDSDIAGLLDKNINLGGYARPTADFCGEMATFYADCFIFSYALPYFTWNIECSTHEMGHLFGSQHTHNCAWNGNGTAIDGCGPAAGFPAGCNDGPVPYSEGGTIMSYCHLLEDVGINMANGFGPQPSQVIRDFIANQPCLATNCETCVNTVFGFAVANPNLTSAEVSWDDESFGPWDITYVPLEDEYTGEWQTLTNNSVLLQGLQSNAYYKFKVRPSCSPGDAYLEREFIFGTAADWCLGTTFTDTGGEGNYGGLEYVVRTLSPQSPGQKIIVEFNEFAVDGMQDVLYVYNGPDYHSPLLGRFNWDGLPPTTFESTAADGSLTFVFLSDQLNAFSGWNANVSCSLLSTESASFANFAYYPNPAKNSVTISSSDDLGEIRVYNVAGQLLSIQKANGNHAVVNISAFADGVYFFTVSNGNKVTNFRIVKQ